jgi:hypothetical protein
MMALHMIQFRERINQTKMTKKFHELMDIDDDGEHPEKSKEVAVQSAIGGSVEPVDDGEEIQIKQDFEDASHNIKDALEWAKEAAEKVLAIAQDSEDDKDFTALNGLLKTIIDGSEKSVQLYTRKMEYFEKKRKVYAPVDQGRAGVYIDKAVFSGTLDQLVSAIDGDTDDNKKEEDD